jgi:hypothetical protein
MSTLFCIFIGKNNVIKKKVLKECMNTGDFLKEK